MVSYNIDFADSNSPYGLDIFSVSTQYVSGGSGNVPSQAQTTGLNFSRPTDAGGATFSQYCVGGSTFDTVSLRAFKDDGTLFMTITMKNVMVASFRSAGGRDSVGLSFDSLAYTYSVSDGS
jgi:type VI protein secretion system component Hcp